MYAPHSLRRATIAALAMLAGGVSAANEARPNFIVILADDLGYGDLGCYGAVDWDTPRLDQLASEGVRFTDGYSGSPWCSSSRAALLTGCYADRISVPGGLWGHVPAGLNPAERTIAEVLGDAGYATALFGKWHLGEMPPFLPTRQGFDEFRGIAWSHGGYAPVFEGERVVNVSPNQRTMTRHYTDRTLQFIKRHKGRPFFVLLSHPMPHHPLDCSEEFRGKSRGGMYGDVIEELDWNIGRLLDGVEAEGLSDRTVVVFCSDNGPWVGRREGYLGGSAAPLRGRKGSAYEGGSRVPWIVRWPGRIEPGRVCDEIVSVQDLLPTFATAADADFDADVIDGRDLGPLLDGDGRFSSPRALYYFGGQAIRVGKWKYFPRSGELYDLHKDLSEETNASASHPDIVERLRAQWKALQWEIEANKRPLGRLTDAPT